MNVLFIVNFPFPYGDASSIRAYNLCKLLKCAGNNIHVISDFPSKGSNGDVDKICTFEHCVDQKQPFLKRKKVINTCLSKICRYIDENHVDVILTNARYDRFHKIAKICKKSNIKLIVENCEWYHYSSFKLKRLDPRYYKNQKMIRSEFSSADGFISISRLLDEHNKSFGKKSVRIPTIMDVTNMDYKLNLNNKKIKIIYTGNPGHSKEFLKPVFEVFDKNRYFENYFEFHIYGPDRQAVAVNIQNDQLLSNKSQSIVIHGKVPQKEMPEIMKNADFLLFMRPDRRSSNAGFPTKFGESMTAGTPVITNNTGDIGLYLKNGENGFLLNDTTPEEVKRVFDEIINLSKNKRESMRLCARKTAEKHFDYRKYISQIQFLLE